MNAPAFWRCRSCGCLWRDNHDGTVSLASAKQTSCPECELKPTSTSCEPLFTDEARVRTVAKALLVKLDVLVPIVDGIIAFQNVRSGAVYTGPNIQAEMDALRALLREP